MFFGPAGAIFGGLGYYEGRDGPLQRSAFPAAPRSTCLLQRSRSSRTFRGVISYHERRATRMVRVEPAGLYQAPLCRLYERDRPGVPVCGSSPAGLPGVRCGVPFPRLERTDSANRDRQGATGPGRRGSLGTETAGRIRVCRVPLRPGGNLSSPERRRSRPGSEIGEQGHSSFGE
jgi:hypothetical protein